MPYWDERVRAMAEDYPERATSTSSTSTTCAPSSSCAPSTSTSSWAPTCSATSCPTSARAHRDDRHRAVGQPQPRGRVPLAVRARARFAPDIAGQGIANPVGQIWAGSMMLSHLGRRPTRRRRSCGRSRRSWPIRRCARRPRGCGVDRAVRFGDRCRGALSCPTTRRRFCRRRGGRGRRGVAGVAGGRELWRKGGRIGHKLANVVRDWRAHSAGASRSGTRAHSGRRMVAGACVTRRAASSASTNRSTSGAEL